ncbi:coiled-coil domain-containing protein [Anaeramoeba flamelloides]|uniref:Vacuolar ATPase assembly protein VMA22 n=1 Tax=Anaeramoeba flamelloides TaxID=1746091 RepID=A0AAV7Y5B6_9EUKA|nr:coiled-coil domain-containing protein [Anaeramoeba flamelloides]KAJ6245284.1 coiled-coil domain-containing protein [Anaeramoeba flamelloides]
MQGLHQNLDQELFVCFQQYSSIEEIRKELFKNLNSGLYYLSQARFQMGRRSHTLNPLSFGNDLIASQRIRINQEEQISLQYQDELDNQENITSPKKIISRFGSTRTPRSLNNAQKSFQETLEVIVQLGEKQIELDQQIKRINSLKKKLDKKKNKKKNKKQIHEENFL